jgi:hypothetical protein
MLPTQIMTYPGSNCRRILPGQEKTKAEQMQTDIDASGGFPTHDPSVQTCENFMHPVLMKVSCK